MWFSIKPLIEQVAGDESRFAGVNRLGVDEHVWHHVLVDIERPRARSVGEGLQRLARTARGCRNTAACHGRGQAKLRRDEEIITAILQLRERNKLNKRLGSKKTWITLRGEAMTSPGARSSGSTARTAGRARADLDRDGLRGVRHRCVRSSDHRLACLSSVAFTTRLIEAGVDPSVGSAGDALDNTLAETSVGATRGLEARRSRPTPDPSPPRGRRPYGAFRRRTRRWPDRRAAGPGSPRVSTVQGQCEQAQGRQRHSPRAP